MDKCTHCAKKTFIIFPCKYCDEKFCTSHVAIEYHDCCNIDRARDKYKKDIRRKMDIEASVVKLKVDNI